MENMESGLNGEPREVEVDDGATESMWKLDSMQLTVRGMADSGKPKQH